MDDYKNIGRQNYLDFVDVFIDIHISLYLLTMNLTRFFLMLWSDSDTF